MRNFVYILLHIAFLCLIFKV